jgi:kynurenine formamidase
LPQKQQLFTHLLCGTLLARLEEEFVRVVRSVDLSVPLDEDTPVYPGDPVPRIRPASTIASDGFNLLSVSMGSQTGTHVDAPYHFADDGARIDQLDLSLFVGPGVVVDVTGHRAREPIGWAAVAPYADRLGPGRILLLHTGWSRHYGTARYYEHPYLDAGACERLLDLGVRTFLLDAVNIDETPDDSHPGVGFPAHHLIADAGGVIGENLRNLGQIDFDPFISCLPLRLSGADGAPVRAVALQLDAGTAPAAS